jgi:hypothetical protein
MNPKPSDAALIDAAVVAIHHLLSRIEGEAADRRHVQRPDELWATQRCLTSAVALLGVSRTLMSKPAAPTPSESIRHWDALVEQTKTAGRAAYEAALMLAEGDAS